LQEEEGGFVNRVEIEDRGKVAILQMNNGVTNAINPELVEDLSEALFRIEKEFQGMVLAGGEKFFSIGFDLPVLVNFKRDEMSQYYRKFNDLALRLFTFPFPVCCLLAGHAVAGGCILALTGDYRLSAAGKKFIGLNEIKLGVPVPYLADLMLRQIVSDRSATQMLYRGEYMTPSEAKEIGLVDEVLSKEDVERQAVEMVSEMTGLPRGAFSAIKANRVEAVKLRYEANHESSDERFLDCWFTESVQALLKEASRKFSKG
jgi:enoyl-CoA hydratase/carnithine racemase